MTYDLLPLFFLVAFLYSTVGHGGASGYWALFVVFGIASPSLAPLALVLNIIVATTGWWQYYRSGFFSWKRLIPFVVASIPAAFIGGLFLLPQKIFSFLLGIFLLLASARIFFLQEIKKKTEKEKPKVIWNIGIPVGLFLGLLSGLLGIGGGIFLSPILLFLQWGNAKQIAALSSAFIVLNSLGGLGGHITRGNVNLGNILPFALVVFIGGYFGSYWGANKLMFRTLQLLLAGVLLIAGIKLFIIN